MMKKLLPAVLLALLLAGPAFAQATDDPGSPRATAPLTILQLNDVYSTVPVNGFGGLARVAALKKQMAAAGRTPLFILAGDFLSPSVPSSVFKGEQMIAALNAAGLDIATIGNHEFDFTDDVLIERMKSSKFIWVASNVVDTRTNRPLGGALPYLVRQFGPLKFGFLGLCLTTSEISKALLTHTQLLDPAESLRRYLPALAQEKVDVIVLISHLAFEDDAALATEFPEIDLIVGGHEHYPITSTVGRTLISKAGSDAKYVARIDVNKPAGGAAERFYELIPITASIPDEPATAAVVKEYEDRLGTALEAVVGETTVPLDAETVRMRVSETNIGDFVADAMREDTGADVALTNAGGIRGDQVYPAGPLSKRTILAMHPLGNVVVKLAVPGRIILQALENGVSKLPASAGQFPQISGMTVTVAAQAEPGRRVTGVTIGGRPLDPDATYTLATTDFMLKGGDNYSMFAGQKVLVGTETGNLLVSAIEKKVAAMKVISPRIEGRIVIR